MPQLTDGTVPSSILFLEAYLFHVSLLGLPTCMQMFIAKIGRKITIAWMHTGRLSPLLFHVHCNILHWF